jgi:hypothetical protein
MTRKEAKDTKREFRDFRALSWISCFRIFADRELYQRQTWRELVPGIGKTTLAKALGAEPRLLLRPDPVHAGPAAQQGWNRVAEPAVEYKVLPGQKE